LNGELLFRAAASLAAVVVMAVLAGRLLRGRLSLPSSPTSALRLRATLALDTRRRLHLVETDAGPVLILTGGATDCLLPWPTRGTPP
jgi:flagellar protein FliO/FliZ